MNATDDHKPAVLAAIAAIDQRLEALAKEISHHFITAIAEGHADAASAAAAIGAIYGKVRYGQNENPGTAEALCGAIGLRREGIEIASQVNTAKDDLRRLCTQLQKEFIQVPAGTGKKGTETLPLLRALLREVGQSDLNLVASYRRITILPGAPTLIAFTRAKTGSVRSISRTEALKHLRGRPSAAIVESLPADTPLALVQSVRPNLRANVRIDDHDSGTYTRMQVIAQMPLLYCTNEGSGTPIVRFPLLQEIARARSRLLEPPIVDTPRIYRYRPEVEDAVRTRLKAKRESAGASAAF